MLRNVIAKSLVVSLLLSSYGTSVVRGDSSTTTSPGLVMQGTGATPTPVPSPCDDVIQACDQAIERLKDLTQKQDEYIEILQRQRDSAMERLKDSSDQGMPWFFWTILGGAAATILMGVAGK